MIEPIKSLLLSGFLCLFLYGPIKGQDTNEMGQRDKSEMQYVFNGEGEVSPFGGPFLGLMPFNGEGTSVLFGGSGGLIYDQRLFFGGYGMGGDLFIPSDHFPDRNIRVETGHGGLMAGFILMGEKVVHPYTCMRFGWGSATGKVEDPSSEDAITVFEGGSVYYMEPELGVGINLSKQFRLDLGVSYRYLGGFEGAENVGVSSTDLNGVQFVANGRFGLF